LWGVLRRSLKRLAIALMTQGLGSAVP
jgi:hypothetical protein